jgi:hypothetical protein
MFGTVSTAPSQYTKRLVPAKTTRAMGWFRHWSRQAASVSVANLLFEMVSGGRVYAVFQHKWLKIL